MEGRKSLLWACSLLCCAGCVTSGAQKAPQIPTLPAPPPPAAAAAAAPAAPAHPPLVEAPKNDPKRTPRFLVALAKLKEGEAKALDRDPEKQFKMRDSARQIYQEALKLDATNIDAHRGLGRVYVDMGDMERAQDIYRKAMTKFPKESIFWYDLAQMHNRVKDFAGATQCLNKALEMDPENRLYITTLGFTLARAGQTEQSVALLARSMGLASAHYNVGRMLLHLQRTEEGAEHLRQAVRANPGLDSAQQLLRDLEGGNAPLNVTLEFQAGQ